MQHRTDCKRGCGYEHTPSCLAQREVVYLGQVGALDHLGELADLVGHAWTKDLDYEPVDGPTGAKSAFGYYEQALSAACAAFEGGLWSLDVAVRAITPAMAEARLVRARMAARNLKVPGRHGWLARATTMEAEAA